MMTKHLILLGLKVTRIFPVLLFIGLAWGKDLHLVYSDIKAITIKQAIYGFSDYEFTGPYDDELNLPLSSIKDLNNYYF